ncbi:MAG: PKD domain-containing protein [Nanoarchaeota archaeon]|nr:PKD domain-containing protein [Nanoarchaeota archaeon]MBU1028069.1 PKD domain-containing protein [Nanoarchaeota archaeon]
MLKRGVVSILLFIFLISLISAGFDIGNLSHKLTKTYYGPSENIKAWINISMDNEPANSIFEDSEDNTITLIELLNLNTQLEEGIEYTCNVPGCKSDYNTIGSGESTKTFTLGTNESKIIGFKINGDNVDITSANFIIESNAVKSCENQLKIDFFNDETLFVKNTNASSDEFCSTKNYGCFDENKTNSEGGIGSVPYCQKIQLSEAPGFKLGAWIKEYTAGNNKIKMTLYTKNGVKAIGADCEIDVQEISTSGGDVSCNINYLVLNPDNYYVCVSYTGSGIYRIKGYPDANGCGFNGFPIKSETASYKIFAQPKKFEVVGNLKINFSSNLLENSIENYLASKYGNLDCSRGCIVPITFESKVGQTIILKNLSIGYNTESFQGQIETDFYDLVETASKISSNFHKISLDNSNLSVRNNYGNYTFFLKLNNEKIFSEKVVIEKMPVINFISPTTTASAFPTTFTVEVEASNITRYIWDFGDNSTDTTTTNKSTHTYASTGTYNLKITTIDYTNRNASKTFSILVRTPEEEINKSLKKKIEDLTNVNNQINNYDVFIQNSLKSALKVQFLDDFLTDLQRKFTQTNSEENYNEIMSALLDLKIPESLITSTSIESSIFIINSANIDLSIVEEISTKDVGENKQDYINAILAWNQENLETKISFKEISVEYMLEKEPLLRIFEIKTNEKNSLTTNPYLILDNLENLRFKNDYGKTEIQDSVYIELQNPQETFIFSTTENVDFIDLPIFISPKISELVVIGPIDPNEEKTSKWTVFALILGLVLVFGFTIYIVLQEWYKRKYEQYLFKNRNNLFNLITYIEHSKRKGTTNKEIGSKLKRAGWKGEQIIYAMKKHAGKRTGMVEIPIKFKKKMLKEESEKRFFSQPPPEKRFKRF